VPKHVLVLAFWIFVRAPFIFAGTETTSFQEDAGTFDEARVAILWDRNATGKDFNDQASFASAFRSVNIQVDTLAVNDVNDLQEYNLLVVANHSARMLSTIDPIIKFVKAGGNLITDGRSNLAEALGFMAEDSSIKVMQMLDRFYHEDTLRLSATEKLARFVVNNNDEVFCSDALTGVPVVVGREYGKGNVMYFGLLFDPVSTGGYSRFPFLLQYVWEYFHLRPILKREFLEMYFDPGFRHGEGVDSLVQQWERRGIKIIHAAGWHQHPTWSYNYTRLIEACHARGMLVYAWLEPPHVSEKFWRQYPQWQEVNYRGEPIPPQWRYLEALTDSACLEKVKSEYANFLNAYDWDGVNLAELYFESDRAQRNPRLYTPMHPSARKEFKTKNGFDPVLLFDTRSALYWKKNHKALNRFERYRTGAVARLHEEFLKVIDSVRIDKSRFDVIVTAFDDIGSPELRSFFGADVRALLKLQKKYKFVLQIEDPQSRWSGDPRRYERIGKRYKALVGQHRDVMLDLNILEFRNTEKPSPFPTSIQTGIECYQMISAAASFAGRVTIYSESSIRENDFLLLPYAASAPATVHRIPNGWKVISPVPVTLQLPERYVSLMMLNGERLTGDSGRFELPEGEYTLLKDE
jgi:hypothetical protein